MRWPACARLLLLATLGCSDHARPVADGGVAEPIRDAGRAQDAAGGSTGGALATRDAGPAPQADLDAGPAAPPRPLLATSGAQLLVSGPRLGLQLTEANLGEDAELVAIHQEFYGIPWAAFEAGQPPPAAWRDLLQQLKAAAKQHGHEVFLSVSMLNGGRERLAATTRVTLDGKVETDDSSSERCYDFARAPDREAKERAFLAYLDFMLALFEPRYLNLAIEVNLFIEKCPEATPGLIALIDRAYAHVKLARPSLPVFPSFQLDHLYGYAKDSCPDPTRRDACFERLYGQIKDIRRDRFAMSSYPFLNEIGQLAALPADWFERAPRRGGERGLIAETGWPSTAMIARSSVGCLTVFDFDETDSAAYLERVLRDATRLQLELVTWWSDRDLVTTPLMSDCPCTFDATWCQVLDLFRGAPMPGVAEAEFYNEVLIKAFGSMGLRHYDGTPKPALARWRSARP
jgi:hypothetical protein